MNRLGMLVDISHVLGGHDAARAAHHQGPGDRVALVRVRMAEHPRNVPDDVLKMLPKNGGVIMVNFYSGFITPEGARMSLKGAQAYRDLQKRYPKEAELQEAYVQWRRENPIPKGSVHDNRRSHRTHHQNGGHRITSAWVPTMTASARRRSSWRMLAAIRTSRRSC